MVNIVLLGLCSPQERFRIGSGIARVIHGEQ